MLRLFLLLLLFSLNATAQQWPVKPIKLIVPHAPGGNSDTFGRILAAKLSERIGQQVIVEADSWLAIFGPAGIPEPVVAKLNQEIAAALNDPPIRERLAGIGLEVVASSSAQLQAMLPGEVKKWGEAVKRSGARVD